MIKRVWIVTRLLIHVLLGLVLTLLFSVPRLLRLMTLSQHLTVAKWWHQHILNLLNVEVQFVGDMTHLQPIVVSNHISWLDILVIASKVRICFVSKAEVRRWPVIGFLAAIAGTVFIRRGSGDSKLIGEQMAQRVAQGGHILFFPEGTTTDGSDVKTFFPRLFAPAIESNISVSCFTLIYEHQPLPHPSVPYIGDQSLWANLMALIDCQQKIPVKMVLHPKVDPQGLDRKHLAMHCHELILAAITEYKDQ